MIKVDVTLPVSYVQDDVKCAIAERLGIPRTEIASTEILRRTLVLSDKTDIHYKATVAFKVSAERETGLLKMRKLVSKHTPLSLDVPTVTPSTRPVVIGAGPAGLFAALLLAEAGARPILYERGLPVSQRAERVKTFTALGVLDTECNVQFGEGGAGTYSDGKLKVGSMDKYKMKVLRTFVECGADEEILYNVGAHVGTDVLSGIVEKIREKLISLGAEVNFGSRLEKIYLRDGRVTGGRIKRGDSTFDFETDVLIMATGHSARDSFELLREVNAPLERRGFGIGMRIEHPREYINRLIYGDNDADVLGTASYHLVTHLPSGRSVYSFCMCPGGVVVPAASEQGGIVTNGMSESRRCADNSNCALLVSVTPQDFPSDDIFAGLDLQRNIEKRAFSIAGGDYKAPASSLASFLKKENARVGSVEPSYSIGTSLVSPDDYLPEYITESIRAAIPGFDAWMPGYNLADAALTGPETRSTSPIKVVRDDKNMNVLGIDGLYAVGEGAGYAGGIVSSARDGLVVAEHIILNILPHL